jgi:hypothetical protein
LNLCGQLLAQGLDPDAALAVHRRGILALKVRSIREGARLTVKTAGNGRPIFVLDDATKGAGASPSEESGEGLITLPERDGQRAREYAGRAESSAVATPTTAATKKMTGRAPARHCDADDTPLRLQWPQQISPLTISDHAIERTTTIDAGVIIEPEGWVDWPASTEPIPEIFAASAKIPTPSGAGSSTLAEGREKVYKNEN